MIYPAGQVKPLFLLLAEVGNDYNVPSGCQPSHYGEGLNDSLPFDYKDSICPKK